MRRLVFSLLLLFAFVTVKAQQGLKGQILPIDSIPVAYKARQVPKAQPVIMVDSVQVSIKDLALWDPQEIKDMKVTREAKYPDGVIYITTKDHQQFLNFLKAKRLSLHELANKYVAKQDKHKPIIYVMNGTLLTDTAGVRVIANRYYDVKITKAAETPYFKKALPNVLIMMVSTIKKITIRGAGEESLSSILGKSF